MPAEPTNRDLYLAVDEIKKRWRESERSLEDYLLALWSLGRPMCDRPALPFDAFVRNLGEALTAPVPTYDEAVDRLPDEIEERHGFDVWEQLILLQIRDLREMREAATFENEYRYFGVDAPRGARWYNFDPASYLEGAAVGTFGGWEEADGNRIVVPGPVAVLGDDGQVTSVDPSEIDNPVFPLPEVTWDAFTDFLQNGQWYE